MARADLLLPVLNKRAGDVSDARLARVFAQAGAVCEEATIQWMCETDGSQSPNDMEAQSCEWHKDVLKPCRSCLVSHQDYRQSRCASASTGCSALNVLHVRGKDLLFAALGAPERRNRERG